MSRIFGCQMKHGQWIERQVVCYDAQDIYVSFNFSVGGVERNYQPMNGIIVGGEVGGFKSAQSRTSG